MSFKNVCLPLLGQLGRFGNRLVSSVILTALSVLLVACVSGGGGGGSSPAPAARGLFSHAGYDFVLANSTRLNAATSARVLGRVYLEAAEVEARLGPGATITGVAYALSDLEREFFSIAPARAADLTNGTMLSFGSPNFPNTPMTLDYIVNTLGVDRMTVRATIAYIDGAGRPQELTTSAPITVTAVARELDVNAFLAFAGQRRSVVNGTHLVFTAQGAVSENGGARASALGNVLRSLNIRAQSPAGYARVPTLYFRLANASGPALAECGALFYLDHQGYGIKTRAAQQLNHEAQAEYRCKLKASLRGVNYTEVVTGPLLTNLDRVRNVTGAAPTSFGADAAACSAGDLAVVRAGGCSYRAGVAIDVLDVNEPVQLNVTLRNASVYEGAVGGLTQDPAIGEVPTQDVLLATVSYLEPDQDAAGTRLGAAAPVLAAVQPRVAAANLFVVRPRAANEVGLYLNASAAGALDYETLAVNATGQKGYVLTLAATDNSTARLRTRARVHLEVKDVVYAPTNLTYRNASDAATTTQELVPGFAQFVSHGGPVLGTLRAVDPETDRSDVLTYAYVGVSAISSAGDRQHNATINGSFALTGEGADQLTLVGLGLRDGDVFTLNLTAVHKDATRGVGSAPAAAFARVGVRARVAYRADAEGYGGRPGLQFTTGHFNGTVAEGAPGASVELGAELRVEGASAAARFDLLDRDAINAVLGAIPGIRTLRPAIDRALMVNLDRDDADVFMLNATTGLLALRPERAAHFTTQPFYTLLARVTNTTAVSPAIYADSDYALLSVVVEDTNTAPRLLGLRPNGNLAQADLAAARLTLDVAEDRPAGTEVARLEVTDDNPLAGLVWGIQPAGAAAGMFQVMPVGSVPTAFDARTGNYTATYAVTTTAALNYEALQASRGRLALTLNLTDGGQYGYERARRRPHALGRAAQVLTVAVDGNVTDVNEPLLLRAPAPEPVREDASVGTRIAVVEVIDPDEDVATRARVRIQARTQPASLTPVLGIANFTQVSANTSRFELVVRNATLLENAGDGRTFEVELVVTENRTDAPSTATANLALTVEDVVHPFTTEPVLANAGNLNLSEQLVLDQGSGFVLREALFRLGETQADYDEFWFGRFRVTDVQARATGMSYGAAIREAPALQNEEAFNLLTLRTRGAEVDLLVGEHRLIEDKLIGEQVALELALVDPSGAVAPVSVSVPVAIERPRADADRVQFADAAANANFEAEVPAAYLFHYTQSAYAAELGASVCSAEDNVVNISIDERCYATVLVADGNRRVNYVQRDRSEQAYFGEPDAALRNGTGGEIGLVLTAREVNISTLGFYALDEAGNLRAALNEFEQYFEWEVEQAYGADSRPALVVRQREFAVLNRTNNQPLANRSYAALDTLPLSGADPRRTLRYFVVAVEESGDARNATQRAIAQMNFVVEATNLNQPAEVVNVTLGGHPLSPDPATPFELVENGLDRGLAGAVNTLSNILNITIRNPDGSERNQSVMTTVDVVATRGEEEGPSGMDSFELASGMASGTDLARVGATAAARRVVNISLGSNHTVDAVLPFQLARNTHGRAFLRARLVENDAEGNEVARAYFYYELRVGDGEIEPPVIADLTVSGFASPVGENDLDALGEDLTLRFNLTLPQAGLPRNLTLAQASVTGENAALQVIAADANVMQRNATTATVTQPLSHALHRHGPTTFTVTTQAREPRGFADEEYIYPAQALAVDPFVIRSQNDPIQVCGRERAVLCADETLTSQPARYRLAHDFGVPPRLNVRVRSSNEVMLYFRDVDLEAADPMPPTGEVRFAHVGVQPFANTTIELMNGQNFNVPRDELHIERVDAGRPDIRVRFPVKVTLTAPQYEGLAARGGTVDLNFTVNVTDRGAATRFAVASARFRITANASDTLVSAGDYAGVTAMIEEGTAAGTNVSFGTINLTDPDIERSGGDTYTYGLTVRRSGQPGAVAGLLRWSHNSPETLRNQAGPEFRRSIQLARIPDDADVGDYTVGWSIHEGEGVNASNLLVAENSFTLTIVNVDDAPVVYCDARNVTDDPSCGYVERTVNLQEIFGAHDAPRLADFRDTGVGATVVLRDPDLLALGEDALPAPAQLSIVNATLAHLNRTDGPPSQDRFELGDGISIARDAANNDRFTVTAPLRLNLTRSSYDFINQNVGGVLRFELNVTHALGSTLARARLVFSAAANNPIFNISDAYTTAVAWPEGTAAGTSLSPESLQINITDPDVTRANGDNYTYTLMVTNATNAPVTDLLAWSDGMSETVQQATQQLNRTLVFAKELDDADVGVYTVTWSIADALNTRASDAPARASSLTLTITNIPDPITNSSMASRAALYRLASDFNPGGERRRTSLRRNATAFFTDGDLLALGGMALPTQAQVVALPMHLELVNVSAFLGDPLVRRVGRSQEIAVVVPVDLNLTDAQFSALETRGETTTFQLNVTVTDADAAAASAWAVTEIIIDTDNDATVVANRYGGGEVPYLFIDNFYWERLFEGGPVFYEEGPVVNGLITLRETNITITDRDINTTAGDTYTYGLSARRLNNRTVIEDLLVWSHGANETLKEQADITFNRTIRFARDPTEADVGIYMVSWNITDERVSLRAPGTAAANGTFTMNIRQTPNATLTSVFPTPPRIINEGADPSGGVVSVEMGVHGDFRAILDYNRSLPGNFLTTNLESSAGFQAWSAGLRLGGTPLGVIVEVEPRFAPRDQQVGMHLFSILVTTAGGTVRFHETRISGSSERVNLAITVNNVDDPTTAAAGTLTGNSRGPRVQLPLFNLNDEDFQIPPRARAIAANGGISLTSGLNLTFSRRAGSAQSCVLPTQERFFEGTLNNDQFQVASSPSLSFNLLEIPACAAIYLNATADPSNELRLTEARLFDYTEPSGGPEQATDDLLIASGQLNITLDFHNISVAQDLTDDLMDNTTGYYLLTANITLASWTPVTNFSGVLDGDQHTITLSAGGALFNTIGDGGIVTDLGVLDGTLARTNDGSISYVYATGSRICAEAGCSSGGLVDTNNGVISDSYATGSSGCTNTPDQSTISCRSGGLVGTNNGPIRNSYATGTSSCPRQRCRSGGLVGINNRALISNSHATGTSSCLDRFCNTGGLAGENEVNARIIHSYATGDNSCSRRDCNSGGLVGENVGFISNSYALGNTSCSDWDCNSGGLVGLQSDSGSIHNSYAIGNSRSSPSSSDSGGLVGTANGLINNSYATGNSFCFDEAVFVCGSGGLVGVSTADNIINSYAAGASTCEGANCENGGLIGDTSTDPSPPDPIASYRAQSGGASHGIARSLTELRCPTAPGDNGCDPTSYIGWDSAIWDFGTSNDLPTIADLPACPTFRPNCRH